MTMKINFAQRQYEALKGELDKAIMRVAAEGDYTNADRAAQFEKELAGWVDVRNAVVCDSLTAAVEMTLLAYGIGNGDAVFLSCVDSYAVAEAVKLCGAVPVFVDVNPTDGRLNLHHLEVQIQKVMTDTRLSPKLIVATDRFGRAEDYLAINEIVRTYGMILLEDAAHSLGGSYKGLKCGCFGHAAVVSFDSASPLSCMGKGGAILTDFNDVAGLLYTCRQHGISNGSIEILGMDSLLDVMQSDLLRVKLRHLPNELAAAEQLAAAYDEALTGKMTLLRDIEGAAAANSEYAVLAADTVQAERIRTALWKSGWYAEDSEFCSMVGAAVFADSRYVQSAEDFPGMAEFVGRAVKLPISPYLTAAEQREIIEIVLNNL